VGWRLKGEEVRVSFPPFLTIFGKLYPHSILFQIKSIAFCRSPIYNVISPLTLLSLTNTEYDLTSSRVFSESLYMHGIGFYSPIQETEHLPL
jgi:hypothetical protein